MPRYHFNVFDGRSPADVAGRELPTIQDARGEAIRLSGALLEADGHRIQLGEDWRMEVTDDRGLILFRLDFTVMEAPAAQQPAPVRSGEGLNGHRR
jgi:hypothetical protein